MNRCTIIAIDLAKQSFHIRANNHRGKALYDRAVSREDVVSTVEQFPKGTLVVMEACGGAHQVGRLLKASGYIPRLIAPQHVKPFLKGQKNDRNDTQAIAEAASRDSARFIEIKSIEQQDIQTLHTTRERWMGERVRLTNALRGMLFEYGVVVSQGDGALKKIIPQLLEGDTLTDTIKYLVAEHAEELTLIQQRLNKVTAQLEVIARNNPVIRNLKTIPGVGTITATALFAAVAHMRFKNGRQLSAFLGLIPRQFTTGGKVVLGRITKTGSSYIRKLLVHGARAVLRTAHKHDTPYHSWAMRLRDAKGYGKAAVALANRNARIMSAILSTGTSFDPKFSHEPQRHTVH